jgi:Tol biopolymer transport system component
MLRSPSSLTRTLGAALTVLALVALLPGAADAQYFGRNKVQYDNFDWQILNTPHFEIFFYPEAEELAARAAVIAEDAYQRLSGIFEHEFQQQVPFILYASPNDFQQTNIADGLIGEGTGGFSEPLRNRMVLPYPGDNAGFVHVINHELVHVFMFDLVYKSLHADTDVRQRWFPIELWMAEGIAEWFSSGWEANADMWMRDATIYDWVVPLHQIRGGYQVYKQGQSAMRYIAKTYGEEKVVELTKTLARTRSVDRALVQTIGLDTRDFSEEWEKSLKKEYWTIYADKQEPEDIGKRLTDHVEDRTYFYQQPSLSPDGRYIAFFSDVDGLVDLFLMDAIEGTIIRKLVTGHRSNQFLTLHSFESSIAFSPDSESVAFVAKAGDDEHLYVVDVESGEVEREVPLRMDIARSPAWSPVADHVVLSGTRRGQTDLYVVDLDTKDVIQITDDVVDEHSPTWYPDGRRVLYSAYPEATADVTFTRTADGLMRLEPSVVKDPEVRPRGTGYDLFSIDTVSREREVVLSTSGDDEDPAMLDEDTIVFVSDLTGVMNLYAYDVPSGVIKRMTDVLGGIFQPSVSAEADRLVFTAFDHAGFDIFLRENFREMMREQDFPQAPEQQFARIPSPKVRPSDELVAEDVLPEHVMPEDTVARVAVAERLQGQPEAVPTTDDEAAREAVAESTASSAPDSAGRRSGDGPEATDTESEMIDLTAIDEEDSVPPGEREGRTIGSVEPYSLRFSLDPVGPAVGGAFYTEGVGFGVAQMLSASDLLGNHRMQFLLNFYGSIEYSDLAASYYYLKRRWNLGFGVFHYRNFVNSNFTSLGEIYDRNRRFSERNYGVFGLASYPFSQFERLDIELQAFVSEKTFYEFDRTLGVFFRTDEKERARLVQPSFSYVHDSTLYDMSGPATGSRWLVSFSPAIPVGGSEEDVDRVTTFVDYRKYIQLWERNTFAIRLLGALSNGGDPRRFVVGGPSTLRGWGIFDFEDIDAAGNPVEPTLLGRKMALMNLEYRFPFVDALILGWPGRWGIGGLQGAVFFDAGAAWDDEIKLTRGDGGLLRLDDLNADIGFGIRTNIGYIPLKFDWAWKTDLYRVDSGSQFHFSIAPRF